MAKRTRLILVEYDESGVDCAYGPIFSSRRKLNAYLQTQPPAKGHYGTWELPYNPEPEERDG